jgi:hypothetical protein
MGEVVTLRRLTPHRERAALTGRRAAVLAAIAEIKREIAADLSQPTIEPAPRHAREGGE